MSISFNASMFAGTVNPRTSTSTEGAATKKVASKPKAEHGDMYVFVSEKVDKDTKVKSVSVKFKLNAGKMETLGLIKEVADDSNVADHLANSCTICIHPVVDGMKGKLFTNNKKGDFAKVKSPVFKASAILAELIKAGAVAANFGKTDVKQDKIYFKLVDVTTELGYDAPESFVFYKITPVIALAVPALLEAPALPQEVLEAPEVLVNPSELSETATLSTPLAENATEEDEDESEVEADEDDEDEDEDSTSDDYLM